MYGASSFKISDTVRHSSGTGVSTMWETPKFWDYHMLRT